MKTGKLTAQVLQMALKKFLEAQKHGPKLHQGQQSLKQLKRRFQHRDHRRQHRRFQALRQEIRCGLHLAKGQDHPATPLHRLHFQDSRMPTIWNRLSKEFTAKKLSREGALHPQGAVRLRERLAGMSSGPRRRSGKGDGAMKPDLKKLVILNLPYLLFVYLFGQGGRGLPAGGGADPDPKDAALHGQPWRRRSPTALPSFHPFDLFIGISWARCWCGWRVLKGKNARSTATAGIRQRRVGGAKDIAPSSLSSNNILLHATERL